MGGSFKNSGISRIGGRVASCYLLEMGDAKSTSLAESQCAKRSAKAVNSADHKLAHALWAWRHATK